MSNSASDNDCLMIDEDYEEIRPSREAIKRKPRGISGRRKTFTRRRVRRAKAYLNSKPSSKRVLRRQIASGASCSTQSTAVLPVQESAVTIRETVPTPATVDANEHAATSSFAESNPESVSYKLINLGTAINMVIEIVDSLKSAMDEYQTPQQNEPGISANVSSTINYTPLPNHSFAPQPTPQPLTTYPPSPICRLPTHNLRNDRREALPPTSSSGTSYTPTYVTGNVEQTNARVRGSERAPANPYDMYSSVRPRPLNEVMDYLSVCQSFDRFRNNSTGQLSSNMFPYSQAQTSQPSHFADYRVGSAQYPPLGTQSYGSLPIQNSSGQAGPSQPTNLSSNNRLKCFEKYRDTQ